MFVSVLMQHKEFLEWPLLLTERLQENNQPRKKSMFVQVQINKTGWVTKREWKGSGKIRDGNNPKMAKRRNTGSLREGGGEKEHMDGTESALRQEEGDKNRWYPSTSSNLYATKQVEMKTSLCFWRFQREGEERLFPCGWVEQEALIRHVWTEVILYASHTPAGQLILGQVKAKAAQLENCSLGFRSLQETH